MTELMVSAVSRRIRWVAGVPDLNKNSPVVHFCWGQIITAKI